MNMCHDSIPHAESYQPNFGTICTINHICSNAYSQPKREGFVDKWRMFTWHQAHMSRHQKMTHFFLHKQSSILVTKHRSLSF